MFAGKLGNSRVRPYAQGFQVQGSVYGATIPVIYGRARTVPLLIWQNNFRQSSGSGKKGKKGGKRGETPTYETNCDFTLGHNPLVLTVEFWKNKEKIPMNFAVYSQAISPGGVGSVTVPNPNGWFRVVLGVTLEVPYDETFSDFGDFAERHESGTFEIPLWNAAYAGPDPTNNSAYRYYPYVYRWLPFSGSTVYLDFNPLRHLPAGTLRIYYTEAQTLEAQNHLFLEWEAQLGSSSAYNLFESQRILYPQYAGLGSPNYDLGAGFLPNARFEVLGTFPLYKTGDADFADMIGDIFKSGPAQAALGIDRSRTEVQHGLGAYEYPGAIQKKFYRSASGLSAFVFDLPNTAGNFLVVFASSQSLSTLGISDSAGNTWTPLFGDGLGYQAWYATALGAESNTVTITNLGDDTDVVLLEIAGVNETDAIITESDTSAEAEASVATSNRGGEPAFILAWTRIAPGASLPDLIPGHWPMAVEGPAFQWVQGRIVRYPGTYTLKNPLSGSTDWAMAMMAFKNSSPPSYPRPLGNILDEESLDLCRRQCRAYGLWGSAVLDAQKKASDWLAELYQAMNAAPVWSGFKLKSIPYAERSFAGNGAVYVSPTAAGPVADLGEADFIGEPGQPFITIEHTGQVDAQNVLQMEHPSRENDYNRVVTGHPEQGAIALYGVRKQSPKNVVVVQDAAIARMLLGIEARRENYQRTTYKFRLNARWKLLEPMDLVTLTDPLLAMFKVPVRLTRTVEDADYNLDCEAVPFIYGLASPQAAQAVATSPSPNRPPLGESPANVNAPIIFQPVVRLSNLRSEVWFVVSNSDENYGGCVVYVSTNAGASYQPLGVIQGNAITGEVTSTWPAAGDPDTANDLELDLSESKGELMSYPSADQDNFVFPCFVEGGLGLIPYELMTYAVAELTGSFTYTLKATGGNKLRRAVFGAPQAGQGVEHASGSRFAFLDPTGRGILKVRLDANWIGKTLKFKFPAFNAFGGGLQSLTGLPEYGFTPNALGQETNPNAVNYPIDPNPVLSQPASELNIVLAEFTAHFPTNSVHYNAREFVVSDPGAGNTVVYYVTIHDPNYVGDTGSTPNLDAFAETNQSKVGVPGYTYCGSIYVTQAGGDVLVTLGGWPPPQGFLVNGE